MQQQRDSREELQDSSLLPKCVEISYPLLNYSKEH